MVKNFGCCDLTPTNWWMRPFKEFWDELKLIFSFFPFPFFTLPLIKPQDLTT